MPRLKLYTNDDCVVGFLMIAGLVLFFLRRRRRRNYRGSQYSAGDSWLMDPESRSVSYGKPNKFGAIAAKIPLLGARLSNNKGWNNLGDGTADIFDEKRAMVTAYNGHGQAMMAETTGGIAVETTFSRTSEVDVSKAPELAPPVPKHILHAAKPTVPGAVPDATTFTFPTIAVTESARTSNLSSLSSGFGDGDIIIPPAAVKPLPSPLRRSSQVSSLSEEFEPNLIRFSRVSSITDGHSVSRETMVSAVSALSDDTTPRFRTVNSWVRHQTGTSSKPSSSHGNDASTPLMPSIPPEQHYNLMRPGGQEPRRVVDSRGDYIGSAK